MIKLFALIGVIACCILFLFAVILAYSIVKILNLSTEITSASEKK